MTENRKKNLDYQIALAEYEAKVNAYDAMGDAFYKKARAIENLLNSSEADHIFFHSRGKRFDALLTKRTSLTKKLFIYFDVVGMMYKFKSEAYKELKAKE